MPYHVSATAGLRTLKPQRSTHGKAYVYAVDHVVTGLLFGAPHDDFDFIIDEENGIPVVSECYPDAFRLIFRGKSCSVYEVAADGFLRGMTPWQSELVCESDVAVLRETPIADLSARLLAEERAGNLILHRYADTAEYRRLVSEHIVDRLVRFDAVYTEDERLLQHYGKLIDALRGILDGHLL